MTSPINRRLISDTDSLSAYETNQLLDYVDSLGDVAPAFGGEIIGRGEGGQPITLREDEIIASITGIQNGSLYEWVQCYPLAVNEDGTPGTLSAAPAGSTTDPTIPKGTLQLLPAYEIKGRIDVPPGTRVFLRKSRRGKFLEFHYDGPGLTYYAPYGTDIPPRFGSVSWRDDADVMISGCTFSKTAQTHTLSIDGSGRLVIVDTLTPVSYTLSFPVHASFDVTTVDKTGTFSGTVGGCSVSVTGTVPGQTVHVTLIGATACP